MSRLTNWLLIPPVSSRLSELTAITVITAPHR